MYRTYTPAITIIHMLPNFINIKEMEGAFYRNGESRKERKDKN